MSGVMTVLGMIEGSELGVTLPHEHIFVDQLKEYRGDGLLNDPDLAEQELLEFVKHGGQTLVDCSTLAGRKPMAVRELARRTKLNIIAGAGFYRLPYIDSDWVDRHSIDELAGGIVREIEEGILGTDVRAGIIGEVGCDSFIAATEERCLRAAARAQTATGLTIMLHAARWPVGMAMLDILEEEGVDLRRVIVGHCDTVPDINYHKRLAIRGAYVEYDTIRSVVEFDISQRVRNMCAMIEAGFLRQMLISHDVCLRSLVRAAGGPGYTLIFREFIPRLKAKGISDDAINDLLILNPRRALTNDDV